MDDACEKPRETNCETKDLVFSDDEEHDLLDHMVKNRRLKKKEQALEAPPRPLRPRFRKKSTSVSTTETM